jgi:serine/arginine repetitive matrix protein 2
VIGVLSALDAATNELASLISRLDLEAAPNTPACTPRLSPSFTTSLTDSPRLRSSSERKDLPSTLPIRPDTASQTSHIPDLRSQRKVPLNTQRYGQQITPWPVSPPKFLQVSPGSPPDAIIAPSVREHPTEPSVVSHSLLPVKTDKPTTVTPPVPSTPSASTSDTRVQHPLSRTFRKMMSTLSLRVKGSESSLGPDFVGLPMSNEARKDLGLAGTLGGSMSPRNLGRSMDPDDPDSDIPNELQAILIGRGAKRLDHFEDTRSSFPTHKAPSPGLPPEGPLPTPVVPQGSIVFPSRPAISVPWMERAQLEDRDGSDSSSLGETDTKRSFDFTGELKKLSESSATHRCSFVEQLEGAFRTPAKYDLDGFGQFGRKEEDIPPVPPISYLASGRPGLNESNDPHAVASVTPLLPSPEIIVPKKRGGATSLRDSSQNRVQKSSTSPKPSHGQLDLNFKFGGTPPSAKSTERSHLTLSDIIPSPAHARSLSMTSLLEDNATQSPNMSQTLSAPSSYSSPRGRVGSISNRPMYVDPRVDTNSSHSRASSQTSFKGFESFDEIRRGFEFAESRPPFYPPSSFNNRCNQQQRDSMISIASVSSYGIVINPGVKDPFDYGRPTSGDASGFMTMSTSIDDTFSFIRHRPRRKRVDSDSSSFYFRPPGVSLVPRPLKNHFRPDSLMSIASLAPPVSIYNRSFGMHRRIDSVSSIGSGAQPCAPYGFAGGNRSSWAPSHRREMSADSVMSDMSVRVPRPALGDKMLDSKHDYCLPLTSIAASPPGSVTSTSEAHMRRQDSFDSILDDESHSYSRDSIMDQSKSSHKLTSECVFGRDWSQVSHLPLDQFNMNDTRPFSLLSAESDSFDPKREDDTMITVSLFPHISNFAHAKCFIDAWGRSCPPTVRGFLRRRLTNFYTRGEEKSHSHTESTAQKYSTVRGGGRVS